MNEVSIIINGVRYDAVECRFNDICRTCDLQELCSCIDGYMSLCDIFITGDDTNFKKSDKKFEK